MKAIHALQTVVKPAIGQCLIGLAEALPLLRPQLCSLGMRTSREWFGGRTVTIRTPGGHPCKIATVPENYLSFELFWRGSGYYEPISTLLAEALVKSGDTFLDIGANIGFYTMMLSLDRPGLRVTSFEPQPKLNALLTKNLRANGISYVACEPLALSDRDGTATFYLNASDMSASLRADFDPNQTGSCEVPTCRLDTYLASHSVLGQLVIKLDVEGHEEAVLEGSCSTMAKHSPDILAEVAFDWSPRAVSLLRDFDYRFYRVTDEGLIESTDLQPTIRDGLVFLNYLLTRRAKKDVAALFAQIEPRVRQMDLNETSKRPAPHMLQQMIRRHTKS